jgi:AcrR family transcriptional regulator
MADGGTNSREPDGDGTGSRARNGGGTGLRARNRARNRAAISDAATRLFIERGFDHVTIAEVAAAADVAKMTVTNHFPRKEDLVLDIHEELVASLADAVAERASGESALAALRRHGLAGLRRRDAALGFSGPGFAAMITGSAALRARLREIRDHQEDALARTLAAETRARPADLTPRIAAGQLATVFRVLFTEIVTHTLAGEDNTAIARRLTRPTTHAFDLLEPALADYAVRP